MNKARLDRRTPGIRSKIHGMMTPTSISTMKAKGNGVEFIMSDNTRVGLTITSGENLKLSVTDSDGKRIL